MCLHFLPNGYSSNVPRNHALGQVLCTNQSDLLIPRHTTRRLLQRFQVGQNIQTHNGLMGVSQNEVIALGQILEPGHKLFENAPAHVHAQCDLGGTWVLTRNITNLHLRCLGE
jgi:hypothetical protein